jgi:acyl-coenzyme A thioesterase 13
LYVPLSPTYLFQAKKTNLPIFSLAYQYFDSVLRNHMNVISASRHPTDDTIGYATFELTVPRTLCNAGDNLHGGAVALIFDMCTSMAVATVSREGFWDSGHVSRTLNCTYLRPAPVGTVLLVECEIVHLGKSLAELRGVMRRKKDGKVCYICEHGKVKVDFASMRARAEEVERQIEENEKSKL